VHGPKIKIFTQIHDKVTDDLIMIDFSDKAEDGKYKLVERIMVNTVGKCGTELQQYNFCGECGTLLGPPEDPEKKWEEFKKAMVGL
jgi:hypothetical protein